ncbi:CBS domain-containing protein [Granulicella cerasi]|nr:CBS domain-containing protein [Granulicella cerasi]
MFRSSIPLGRFFGVHVRVHLSFLLLLALFAGSAPLLGYTVLRGLGLWLALVAAVIVRELARGIAAAYVGMDLRAVFLFPIGGVMALAQDGAQADKKNQRIIAMAGPAANVLAVLIMVGTAYAFQPGLHLLQQPWLTFAHILRAFVWMQVVIAITGLLPSALPNRKLLARRGETDAPRKPMASTTPPFHLGSMVALAVALAGIAMMNPWIIAFGGVIFLIAQVNFASKPQNIPPAISPLVHEVMLTDIKLISSSDTLAGALNATVHSMQEIFPVVRGEQLVGSVTRDTIITQLRVHGDGYVQGVMSKTLHFAQPQEKLTTALERSAQLGASEFIPVVEEDGRLLGILTPGSLARAVQLVRVATPERGDA